MHRMPNEYGVSSSSASSSRNTQGVGTDRTREFFATAERVSKQLHGSRHRSSSGGRNENDDENGAAGTVARTPVTVEPTNTGRVRVTDGLEEGQEIVASGAAGLKDGDRVARFGTFPE